jgi:predicted nucleic acid-binding protein
MTKICLGRSSFVLRRVKKCQPNHDPFPFWDSLIVAAALHGGATVLYSEDMQTGLTVNDRLTIHNPFDAALDSLG